MALTQGDLKSIKGIVDESIEAHPRFNEVRVGIVAELSAKIDRSAQEVIAEITGVVVESQDVIAEVMEEKFAAVDARFDEHDRRFDEHDRRFDSIERRLGKEQRPWE